MLASLINNFSLDFIKNISLGYRDILDILIISFLIYAAITLFRKTKSMPILIGIVVLALIYMLSLALNLPLTQTVFQSFFGFFLIILAIVFQRELRRFFEYIGILGIKRKILPPPDQTLKTILSAAKYFTEHKIGALIVFPGKENLERHFEGGHTLNGKISEALLISIFDASSPGHDGAVIIENDKIRKFAVHLPMAENIEAVKKFGTRHRAALGLAEVSDAFCIVISEEKGTISIAANKQLITLKNFESLEKYLHRFLEEKFPKRTSDSYKKWLKKNGHVFAISLISAFIIWLIFSSQVSLAQRKFVLPIEFKNLPPNYAIEAYYPEEVVATLSGRDTDLSLIDPKNLKISIDASKIKPGWHNILINQSEISRPPNISTVKIDPESISIQITQQ